MTSNFSNFKETSRPAILLAGPPGTGKTVTLSMLGTPFIIELDNNHAGAFNFLQSIKADCKATVSVPFIRDDGTIVPRAERWKAMNAAITAGLSNPLCTTLGIDSLSALIEIGLDEVRRQQNRKIGDPVKGEKDEPLQIQDWGAFKGLMRQWFINLRAAGKVLVVTAHITTYKDELTGILQEFINFPGQFAEEIAGLFTEVWLTDIEEKRNGSTVEYIYTIRTRPQPSQRKIGLKSGIQLPPKVPVDFANLNKLLFS